MADANSTWITVGFKTTGIDELTRANELIEKLKASAASIGNGAGGGGLASFARQIEQVAQAQRMLKENKVSGMGRGYTSAARAATKYAESLERLKVLQREAFSMQNNSSGNTGLTRQNEQALTLTETLKRLEAAQKQASGSGTAENRQGLQWQRATEQVNRYTEAVRRAENAAKSGGFIENAAKSGGGGFIGGATNSENNRKRTTTEPIIGGNSGGSAGGSGSGRNGGYTEPVEEPTSSAPTIGWWGRARNRAKAAGGKVGSGTKRFLFGSTPNRNLGRRLWGSVKDTAAPFMLGSLGASAIMKAGEGVSSFIRGGQENIMEASRAQAQWSTYTNSKAKGASQSAGLQKMALEYGQGFGLTNETARQVYMGLEGKNKVARTNKMTESILKGIDAEGMSDADAERFARYGIGNAFDRGKVTKQALNEQMQYAPQMKEIWAKSLAADGVKVNGHKVKDYGDVLSLASAGKLTPEMLERALNYAGSHDWKDASKNMLGTLPGIFRALKQGSFKFSQDFQTAFSEPLGKALQPLATKMVDWFGSGKASDLAKKWGTQASKFTAGAVKIGTNIGNALKGAWNATASFRKGFGSTFVGTLKAAAAAAKMVGNAFKGIGDWAKKSFFNKKNSGATKVLQTVGEWLGKIAGFAAGIAVVSRVVRRLPVIGTIAEKLVGALGKLTKIKGIGKIFGGIGKVFRGLRGIGDKILAPFRAILSKIPIIGRIFSGSKLEAAATKVDSGGTKLGEAATKSNTAADKMNSAAEKMQEAASEMASAARNSGRGGGAGGGGDYGYGGDYIEGGKGGKEVRRIEGGGNGRKVIEAVETAPGVFAGRKARFGERLIARGERITAKGGFLSGTRSAIWRGLGRASSFGGRMWRGAGRGIARGAGATWRGISRGTGKVGSWFGRGFSKFAGSRVGRLGGKFLRGGGRLLKNVDGVNLAFTAMDTIDALSSTKAGTTERHKRVGAALGTGIGTGAGAFLGSIIPGAGTVAGGLVGGMIGGAIGNTAGSWLGGMWKGKNDAKHTKNAASAQKELAKQLDKTGTSAKQFKSDYAAMSKAAASGSKEGAKAVKDYQKALKSGSKNDLKEARKELDKWGKSSSKNAKVSAKSAKAQTKSLKEAAKQQAKTYRDMKRKEKEALKGMAKDANKQMKQVNKSVKQGAKQMTKSMKQGMKQMQKAVKSSFKRVAKTAKQSMKQTAKAVKQGAKQMTRGMKRGMKQMQRATKRAFKQMQRTAKRGMKQAAKSVKQGAKQMNRALKQSMKQMQRTAKSAFKRLSTAAKSGMKRASTAVKSGAKRMSQSMKSGLRRMATAAKSAFRRLSSAVKSGMNRATSAVRSGARRMSSGLKSGMNRMASVARSSMSRLASAVRSGINRAASAMRSGTSRMTNALRSGMNRLGSAARSSMAHVSSAIKSGMAHVTSAIKSGMERATSAMKASFDRMASAASSAVARVAASMAKIGSAASAAASQVKALASAINSLHSKTITIRANVTGKGASKLATGTPGALGSFVHLAGGGGWSSNGGTKAGMYVVNDAPGATYREAFRLKNGLTGIFPAKRNMVVPLPEGTQVLNAKDTKRLFPRLEHGTPAARGHFAPAKSQKTTNNFNITVNVKNDGGGKVDGKKIANEIFERLRMAFPAVEA